MEKSHKSLEEKGWMFQFVADGPLADDAEKIYNLLGFEVLRLPVGKPWFKKTISFSYEKPPSLCEVVYVRPKKQTENEEMDLI
jgi:hypothetical protein